MTSGAALGWLAKTLLFELHLGVPGSSLQWMKRLAGWAVEVWLLRTLVLGVGRCQRAFATK